MADYIRRRGRIAIGELAQRSNDFIDLAPREAGGSGAALAAELELPPKVVAAA